MLGIFEDRINYYIRRFREESFDFVLLRRGENRETTKVGDSIGRVPYPFKSVTMRKKRLVEYWTVYGENPDLIQRSKRIEIPDWNPYYVGTSAYDFSVISSVIAQWETRVFVSCSRHLCQIVHPFSPIP